MVTNWIQINQVKQSDNLPLFHKFIFGE